MFYIASEPSHRINNEYLQNVKNNILSTLTDNIRAMINRGV